MYYYQCRPSCHLQLGWSFVDATKMFVVMKDMIHLFFCQSTDQPEKWIRMIFVYISNQSMIFFPFGIDHSLNVSVMCNIDMNRNQFYNEIIRDRYCVIFSRSGSEHAIISIRCRPHCLRRLILKNYKRWRQIWLGDERIHITSFIQSLSRIVSCCFYQIFLHPGSFLYSIDYLEDSFSLVRT